MEELEQIDNENKIADWLKRGEAFIFKERLEEWKDCVEARAKGMYNGRDLDTALNIMENLNSNGELSKAKELLEDETQSAGSYTMVSQIVFAFSNRGPEFLEYIMNGNISEETRKAIENKRRENLKLAQANALADNNTSDNNTTTDASQEEHSIEQINEVVESTVPEASNVEEETNIANNENNYLQIRKDNIFTRIVTFIRKIFFSRKYKEDTTLDTKDI